MGMLVVLGIGIVVAGAPAWMGVVLATGALLAWLGVGCRHPRPLALLPPTVGPDGLRHSAQWFCAACGRSWPAGIEHANPPVQKFVGHDPSKAIEAAKRAAALEISHRELAVQRAGMKQAVVQTRKRGAGPVAIDSRRVG